MTSRTYDQILTLNNATNFVSGNNFYGLTSQAYSSIVNVIGNNVKVKNSNVFVQYSINETVISTATITTNASANINVQPYEAPKFNSQINTATAVITAIYDSPYIKEKNATEQNPLVRLYTIYYPGEWYPTNSYGNPSGDGEGISWPYGFPYRFAELQGDFDADISYSVLMDDTNYTPYPINSGSIRTDSTGRINELDLAISNFDNLIGRIVENPFLVGNTNTAANSAVAIVNGQTVVNIDPRTVPGDAKYNASIAASRGINSAHTYETVKTMGDIWVRKKLDTRDLLGAVVEVKSTFANFLDFWPEYSTVTGVSTNYVTLYSSLPYRIGDNVRSNATTNTFSVTDIIGNNVYFSTNIGANLAVGNRAYIINQGSDPDSYVLDTFKIAALSSLDSKAAKFKLTNWLQHFRLQLPRRKYFKHTCTFTYKGDECKYPNDGTGLIPNANTLANGYFTITNANTTDIALDVCAHNLEACRLRNNAINFGGFPGTGITIPR